MRNGRPGYWIGASIRGIAVWENRILIAEDNEILLDATATALELAGYLVDRASDGAEALDAIEHNPPAAILLDLRMPVVDGYGVAQELKRRGLRIPIIVMTTAEQGQFWARKMDAVAFLPKPFGAGELVAMVQRLGLWPRGPDSAVA